MYGWTGKVLRVDLTNGKITKEDDTDYAEKFSGGLGFSSKIYWDEVSPEVQPFDPENKLIFSPGVATGTCAPGCGRTEMVSKSPASYPVMQYCRSGVGATWGQMLKFAGYDSLIIQGKADKPVYLWIHDDQVEIKDASHLWGHGTFITTDMIKRELGDKLDAISIAAIGQAGENLASTAAIVVNSRSAAGQGGMGAVMGSKNLKTIAVNGTGIVPVAQPDELLDLYMGWSNYYANVVKHSRILPYPADKNAPAGLGPYGFKRLNHCGQCSLADVDCAFRVPSPAGGTNEAWQKCASNVVGPPLGPYTRSSLRGSGNDWGLNLYEIGLGIAMWLQYVCMAGYLPDVGGVKPLVIPEDSPAHPSMNPVATVDGQNSYDSLFAIMKTIAFKEGDIGRILGKGSLRAADEFGFGKEECKIMYPSDGFNDHCGSRWSHTHFFPLWIWDALTRVNYHRDPADHITHSTCDAFEERVQEWGGEHSWETMNELAQYYFGEPSFTKDYKNKERTMFWMHRQCEFNVTLAMCDSVYRMLTIGPAGKSNITTPKGNTFEYQDMPSLIFNYVTGKSIDRAGGQEIGERIWNLERAITLREGYQGRKGGWFTKTAESCIPYYVEWGDVQEGIHMDADEFRLLMDRYYDLAGWDKETAMPTRETLERLGLKYVADELTAMGKLP